MLNEDYSAQQQALDEAIRPNPTQATPYFSTKRIAYIAMLISLSIVIGTFSPRLMGNKLTFSYTINFLAGYFFGGVAGILVGGLGDLFGCLLAGYAPNPIVLVSSCLLGLVPALVRKIKLPYIIHPVISFAICTVVCSSFLNTFGLMAYSGGRNFWAYMAFRMSTQIVVIAVNLVITLILVPVIGRIPAVKNFK